MISLICRLEKTAYRYGEQTGDCQIWGSGGEKWAIGSKDKKN